MPGLFKFEFTAALNKAMPWWKAVPDARDQAAIFITIMVSFPNSKRSTTRPKHFKSPRGFLKPLSSITLTILWSLVQWWAQEASRLTNQSDNLFATTGLFLFSIFQSLCAYIIVWSDVRDFNLSEDDRDKLREYRRRHFNLQLKIYPLNK